MDKIYFDKNENQYEVLRYEKDENGYVHSLCPYGIKCSDKEYEEHVRFAMCLGNKPPSQVYLVGSVMCVRKCKYCKDEMNGVDAILCGYKAEHPNVTRLPRREDYDDLNDYLKAISK